MQFIIKRNGRKQAYDSSKIKRTIESLMKPEYAPFINMERILGSFHRGLGAATPAEKIKPYLAENIAQLGTLHPAYEKLAGQLALHVLYRETPDTFSKSCMILGSEPGRLLNPEFLVNVVTFRDYLDIIVSTAPEHEYSYSAVKTMEKIYLMRKDGKIIERPKYMYMRVALALNGMRMKEVLHTFDLLVNHYYIHATPTMAQCGARLPQLSSCFLLSLNAPYTTENIYNTLGQCAEITNNTGGIGINFNQCPAIGSLINGKPTTGLPPLLQLFNSSLAISVNGQNRRSGALAAYVEPWHADIFFVLDMRRNRGQEHLKARRIFYGIWMCDLFMKRVRANTSWTLFSPEEVPMLTNSFGEAFEAAYIAYELNTKVPKTTIPARTLWNAIMDTQIETGGPFILYKDSINRKSNQQNLGVITHSNLCTEVTQYSTSEETAVCNLASIILPTFAKEGAFDFERLSKVVQVAIFNLNRVIDTGLCPTATSNASNARHRAVGLGIQGLADTFIALGIPFDSDNAQNLSTRIAQTMYYSALKASNELAKVIGCYSSFRGSPISQGLFQFDLWNVAQDNQYFDWNTLRQSIETHGLANSLLIALMPTAGTSLITGCSEGFDPIQSNVFSRRTLSGEYQVLSDELVSRLVKMGLWSEIMRCRILRARGSIQGIEEIPKHLRNLFKTAWEIGPQAVLDMAIARGPYICQSQSMSIHMEAPTANTLAAVHFHGWEHGLKTGMYYLRTRPASHPIQITVPISPITAEGSDGHSFNTDSSDCGSTTPDTSDFGSDSDDADQLEHDSDINNDILACGERADSRMESICEGCMA